MCWPPIMDVLKRRFLKLGDPPVDADQKEMEVDRVVDKANSVADDAFSARLEAQSTVMEGRKMMERQNT